MVEPRYDYTLVYKDAYGQNHAFLTEENTRCPDVVTWCKAEFGEAHDDGRWTATHSGDSVWIRDEPDALHFRLRWC